MSNYCDSDIVAEINQAAVEIFKIRNKIYEKYKIDVLDTDTLSSAKLHEIVNQYDPEYNVNFARNGEDAKSGDTLIEQKTTRVEKKKRSGKYPEAAFQFHAMGDLEHSRYIFAARDRNTLEFIKIYDISKQDNIKIIQDHLLSERKKWLDKGFKDQSKMKRDVINLPESILSSLSNIKKKIINNCEVILA